MSERSIILHPHELTSALAGTLRQVRRPVVPQPRANHYLQDYSPGIWIEAGPDYPDGPDDERPCPLGQPGDVIWGRERCRFFTDLGTFNVGYEDGSSRSVNPPEMWLPPSYDVSSESLSDDCYPVGMTEHSYGCRANHMPRWASRWARPVAAVRVERLQDMTPEDAEAWGVQSTCRGHLRADAWCLWDSLYQKKFPWMSNPWQWVAEIGGAR